MKTMMKLGLALIIFGLVMSLLGSLAIRAHGESKLTVRDGASTTGAAGSAVSASASGAAAASK